MPHEKQMMDNQSTNNQHPILLVGGGTGGHIFPLVAIGEELASLKIPFIFIGGRVGREGEVVAEYGWPFKAISAGKWRRYWSLAAVTQNILDVGRFIRGYFQALSLLITTGSPVIFSKGGYVALPMVMAAKLLGRRIVIHESDSVMGLTNRISVRVASKVLTAFSPSVFPNHDSRFEQVGIPIRRTLRQAANLQGVRKSRPLILVIAGIQGSKAINRFVREALPEIVQVADVVHITGEAEILSHKTIAQGLSKKYQNAYRPFAFITRELPYYFRSSDLIVSRASATTIAEAALFSRAMYLVPLPNSASDHQLANALHLQAAGAAVLREEKDLNNEKFTDDIKRLLADKAQLQNLGARLSKYFNEQGAVERTVEVISKGETI
ncbi:MAG: UDP-N-acetylglucosamine--N-acetylmuramyl-(pentapeptide) pyrophosphoryl-undecaprenol N-acetylglucosamine transferase, partial [Candidatus Berkelbacteria bacterium]|nr:UDP-N-acetylglucosamine--N-acetylmuramyl-(pentapeptide) pyrophosphoryl-undecaprenol N-acetylglucosamine transferase [Candidatus Berkelbacteria bacterium]MCR4308243.1 UDP-N-acetylglucosamine--N-acetylmuramyl-(pentapeptide) pyrophosphoryl-undecaprenol N-acetylglucosamine transferase [Candidatus Berkelbacteria bacterium]